MIELFYAVLMVVISLLYLSWILIFLSPGSRRNKNHDYAPISVVIPAYNEEKNIRATIESILKADYPNKKEIIVVNDGSRDKTPEIVKEMMKKHREIKLIKTDRIGKGRAVNAGVKKSRNELFAILDADTEIEKNALMKLFGPFEDGKVGAVSTTLAVKRSHNPLNWYQQLDYVLSSSWRLVVDKVGGSCIVPGFCAFRKSAFENVGGFHGDSCVEDYDICMYLKKAGYKISIVSDSVAYTKVPETLRGFFRQRVRWSRGTLQVIRKHSDMLFRHGAVGLYSMPTQLYWFVHAVLYVPLVFYQMIGGYYKYFVIYGNAITPDALIYFIKWITTYGMAEFIYNFALGIYPVNMANVATIVVFSLSYSFLILSLLRFPKKVTWEMIFAVLFFFPYSVCVLTINIYTIFYEMFSTTRGEKWEKED